MAMYARHCAKGLRDRFSKLTNEKAGYEKEKEKVSKVLKTKENKLEKVLIELEKVKGPFQRRLDVLLEIGGPIFDFMNGYHCNKKLGCLNCLQFIIKYKL